MSIAPSEDGSQEMRKVHDPAEPEGHHEDMAIHMHEHTFWVYFCCCYGAGCGHCGDPMIMAQNKCLCCYGSAQTEECYSHDEGLIYSLQKMCCLVTHFGCPPGGGADDGIPCCAVCGQECGGEDSFENETTENAIIVQHTCLCAYCLCCGVGCHGPGDPLCKISSKVCCVRQDYGTEECCSDEGCCYSYDKICCCVTAAVCPPGGGKHDGLPMCAVCNMKCGGEDNDNEP